MKFNGTTLAVNPDKGDVVIDSGYDAFGKNVTVVTPDGWCAVLLQNEKHVANGSGTFTLASKKGGVKFPLFGDLKLRIIFVRMAIESTVFVNDSKVTSGGRSYTMTANFSYKAEFKAVDAFLKFMKDLKINPGARGVMMTKGDFSYVIETVLPGYLKPGDAGYTIRTRTPQEKAYLAALEEAFLKKALKPIGWEGVRITVSNFKMG